MWTISLTWRKGNLNKNTSDELRSVLYLSDSEDDLDVDHVSVTCGAPGCTVRPVATFVNDVCTRVILPHCVFLNKCLVLFGQIMNTILKYIL